jgi:hypothetical protein
MFTDMDLIKQYISQCIGVAANNLRLSTSKIEVVAMLKELISKSSCLDLDVKNMKKITQLSKLAIRMNDIFNYLSHNKVDFLKISEKFKEHTQLIIKDLNFLLENVTPSDFKDALTKLKELSNSSSDIQVQPIDVDLSKRATNEKLFEKNESEKIKEKIILEEDKDDDDMFFHNYEATVMKPVKDVDALIKKLTQGIIDSDEITNYAKVMKINGDLSEKFGTDIITNMHRIIAKALLLIKYKDLECDKEVTEALRACLIVIVALVRNKEVDINIYLNRAEDFGEKIKSIKIKGK